MSQSVSAKFTHVLQPSPLGPSNRQLPPSPALKAAADSFQRTTVRKSFKRKLPQQDDVANQNALPDKPAGQPTRTGSKNSFGPDPPPSVARRNARERNRVKQVNTGFAILRQHIPVLCGSVIVYGGSPSDPSTSPSNSKKNKMSKVETLRCAVEYIRNLERLLATGDVEGAVKVEQDCALYDAQIQESRENISPIELGLSAGEDLSGFYDSSSSPESQSPDGQFQDQRFLFPFVEPSGSPVLPTSDNKRIKAEEQQPPEALFKQDLLRTLCWPDKNANQSTQQQLPELLLDQSEAQQSAIQAISDQSLLESLNSWWGTSL